MNKKLNNYQTWLWLMGRDQPFIIQWTVTVSGQIEKHQIEAALILLQRQHPLLNCTITAKQPFEFKSIHNPIRVRQHARENDQTWEKYALQALSQSLPLSEEETFFIVDWVAGKNTHEFIFTIDHAFSDGRNLTGLGCDFLHFLDQIIAGVQNIEITHYAFRPPQDTLLPLNKPPAPPEPLPFSWGDAETPLLAQPPYKYKLPYLITFTEEKTSRLLSAARRHHCSLHAMLCAAMTIALNDYLTKNLAQGITFCFTPGDLRPYLNADILPKELGNFAVGIFHPFKIGEVLPFWLLATQITGQIRSSFASDALANKVQGFGSAWYEGISSKEVVNRVKIRDACAAVSNLGIISLAPKFQHFTFLKARISSASPIMSGRGHLFWLVAETIYGRLQLEFLRTHPGDDANIIPEFAQQVSAILDCYVDN